MVRLGKREVCGELVLMNIVLYAGAETLATLCELEVMLVGVVTSLRCTV